MEKLPDEGSNVQENDKGSTTGKLFERIFERMATQMGIITTQFTFYRNKIQ